MSASSPTARPRPGALALRRGPVRARFASCQRGVAAGRVRRRDTDSQDSDWRGRGLIGAAAV
eukprot:8914571-Pyramimonas_sp.AAC.1